MHPDGKKWPKSYEIQLVRIASAISHSAMKDEASALKKLQSARQQLDGIIGEMEARRDR